MSVPFLGSGLCSLSCVMFGSCCFGCNSSWLGI